MLLSPFLISMVCLGDLDYQTFAIDPGLTSIQTKVMRFGVVPVISRLMDISGKVAYSNDLSMAVAAE